MSRRSRKGWDIVSQLKILNVPDICNQLPLVWKWVLITRFVELRTVQNLVVTVQGPHGCHGTESQSHVRCYFYIFFSLFSKLLPTLCEYFYKLFTCTLFVKFVIHICANSSLVLHKNPILHFLVYGELTSIFFFFFFLYPKHRKVFFFPILLPIPFI
jgi:hypothetical protein